MMSERVSYGGQAVIEGVMMRGRRQVVTAVRSPEGEILLRTESLGSGPGGSRLAQVPVLRGLVALWDTLRLGIGALMWSAEVAAAEEGEALQGTTGWFVVGIGVAAGVGLFMLLPSLLVGVIPLALPPLVQNLLEGLVRLGLVIGYIWAVGRMPDMRRVFAYHGAEHKVVSAWEAGAPLTVESAQAFPTTHPRCGTSFLFGLVLVSTLLIALLGRPPLLWRMASRLVLIPLIAGLAYEFIRLSGRYGHRPWMRWLVRPGEALQRLTTAEPDGSMVEVAIRALETVLASEAAGED